MLGGYQLFQLPSCKILYAFLFFYTVRHLGRGPHKGWRIPSLNHCYIHCMPATSDHSLNLDHRWVLVLLDGLKSEAKYYLLLLHHDIHTSPNSKNLRQDMVKPDLDSIRVERVICCISCSRKRNLENLPWLLVIYPQNQYLTVGQQTDFSCLPASARLQEIRNFPNRRFFLFHNV